MTIINVSHSYSEAIFRRSDTSDELLGDDGGREHSASSSADSDTDLMLTTTTLPTLWSDSSIDRVMGQFVSRPGAGGIGGGGSMKLPPLPPSPPIVLSRNNSTSLSR